MDPDSKNQARPGVVQGGKGTGKEKPSNLVIPPKRPKPTKAERRAQQERQRAEKAALTGGGKSSAKSDKKITGAVGSGEKSGSSELAASSSRQKKGDNPMNKSEKNHQGTNSVQLFDHLPAYNDIVRPASISLAEQAGALDAASLQQGRDFHPAILHLAIAYREGTVMGGNRRCRAMLRAFQKVIEDYFPPPVAAGKRAAPFTQDLDFLLKLYFTFLTKHSRPHATSMGNAFTFLKMAILNLGRDIPLSDAKRILTDQIDAYIRERIHFADEAIANHAMTKIQANDVILVYGHSEVVEILLRKAYFQMKQARGSDQKKHDFFDMDFKQSEPFRVIVVDSRPLFEGQTMLRALREAGIPCTYVYLSAVSYVMSSSKEKVSKVFLGASALMSNGAVQSRVGTYSIALMAQSCNVPVLVCCETYKISNRVQLESITGNELGNPDWGVASTNTASGMTRSDTRGNVLLRDWRKTPSLKLLNILYDLTPSEYVSGIVTEMGILPPTSVAVILREMNPQDSSY